MKRTSFLLLSVSLFTLVACGKNTTHTPQDRTLSYDDAVEYCSSNYDASIKDKYSSAKLTTTTTYTYLSGIFLTAGIKLNEPTVEEQNISSTQFVFLDASFLSSIKSLSETTFSLVEGKMNISYSINQEQEGMSITGNAVCIFNKEGLLENNSGSSEVKMDTEYNGVTVSGTAKCNTIMTYEYII